MMIELLLQMTETPRQSEQMKHCHYTINKWRASGGVSAIKRGNK
jgi:hypothetical protein